MNKKDLYKRISLLVEKYKDDLFLSEEVTILYERIKSVESSIVVVGQFSVGKSALLNALLGESLLSTRRIESTKVITRIRDCQSIEQKRIVLFSKDGQSRELSIDEMGDLDKYTTFQGGKGTDELRTVDVYWPLSFLNNELMLVDTPGANSLTKEAFTVTELELQKASAVLFLFNGLKGLDQTDFALLTDLMQKRKKVFIVATHVDGLTEKELSQVLKHVKEQIKIKINHIEDIKIYPVSSTDALEAKQSNDLSKLQNSNILDLEEALFTYMKNQDYIQAELESIFYDLEKVEQMISEVLESELSEKAARERENNLRLERLKLLTKQEYDLVKEYGFDLLTLRENRFFRVLDEWKNKIDGNNKVYKTEVFLSFKKFKEKMIEATHLESTSVKDLKDKFMEHNETINSVYHCMINQFESSINQLELQMKDLIEDEDTLFVQNLETNQSGAKINWPVFKEKLKSVDVRKREIDYDSNLFKDYEDEKRELKSHYKLKQNQLERLRKESKAKDVDYSRELKQLENELEEEIKHAGNKPKPREITERKGIWPFRKDVVVGYDYTKPKQWEQRLQEIYENYESSKLYKRSSYQVQVSSYQRNEEKLEDELDSLMKQQEELENDIFTELIKSIDNQKQKAQESYKLFEQEVLELWKIQARQASQQFNEHTDHIRQQFIEFVEDALKVALSHIKIG
jgi:GTPase Era involved in 16S rRNA processing